VSHSPRFLHVFNALVLTISSAICLSAAEPDLNAPLPIDPSVKMGTLPNKLSYWIRAHKTPPGKVNLWLHIGSGSINEDDNQRGLAHFLEHMAFNGSANFAAGTLVKYFESLGLRFGQDQNAFTSFDQTTYKLTLPDTKPETIQKGMTCLADFGYRLLLPNEKLETERGVILEESRTRKGASQRITDKLLPLIAPGSRFSERLPIGIEDIISKAERKRFEEYYAKWYRPDNSILIVVGDIDPAAIEKSIQENFGDWKPAAEIAKDADPGLKEYTTVRAAVITDPELTSTEVGVTRIGPLLPRETIADFRRDLVESIGDWILNRRYNEMVAKGTAPFQSAAVGVSPFLNVSR
jgi:zinc protease